MDQKREITDLLREVGALRKAWRQVSSAIASRTAPDFTPFQFVRTDELGLSQIVRWLFDPNGSHGQRGLFLRAFLEEIIGSSDFSDMVCDRAEVRCEVATTFHGQENRRIDILIQTEDHCLAIENKPWAQWQEAQISAYLDDISQHYPNAEKRRIVALKGWIGTTPPEQLAVERRGELIDTDWPAFTEMLRGTIPACEAESVRRFLEQFCNHLDQLFQGISMSVLSHQITDHILAEESLARSAFELIDSRADIFDALAKQFENQLREKADGKNLSVLSGFGSSGVKDRWPGVSLSRTDTDGPVFRVAFGNLLQGGFWGLPNEGNAALIASADRLARLVRTRLGPVRHGDGWLWWQNLNSIPAFDTNAKMWAAMRDGTLADETVAQAVAALAEVATGAS
jgi:hypothetical protein